MRIAIIGSGISGLATAWSLHRDHDVVVFEAASAAGGHTHTVTVEDGAATLAPRPLAIDMGFIVFNDRTYPDFCHLLDTLGVAGRASDMSLSVRDGSSGVEWCGSESLASLFAQRRNLASPRFWRMLLEIARFHRLAPTLLDADPEVTFGDILERHRFHGAVVDHYLLPMTAAIWSTPPQLMRDFPVRNLAAFLANHGMLQVRDRPRWRTVAGGSRTYVDRLAEMLGRRLVVNSPIRRVRPCADGEVAVELSGGSVGRFDQVVIATHSDQALRLLAAPSPAEQAVLGAIRYQENDVVLHTDARLMPRCRRAWASWNVTVGSDGADHLVRVTYWMNRLQGLDARRDYFVTLNRSDDIDPEQVLVRRRFAHPLFTREALRAQARWGEISGRDRIHYAGAYWGWGFHEDGLKSGLRVAEEIRRRSSLGAAA